jgi:hypothetical protein
MNIKFNFLSLLNNLENINYNNLYEFFSKNHKYNLFVKKMNKEEEKEDLLMIHNNQENSKIKENEIYRECRSIIIDVSEKTKVISYSHDNVFYSTVDEYKFEDNDIIEESFEGTMINVFYHNDKWYFSSTRCPSIDESFFFTDKKSHGEMFNEILSQYYKDVENVRDEFVKNLDKNKCYFFVILHHENKYIVDYTSIYDTNYKKLVHIITRDKETQIEENNSLNINFLIKPNKFNSFNEAKEWLQNNNTNCNKEGLIIKRKNQDNNKNILIKIPSNIYTTIRIEKPNYANIWVGCIEIFQRNNPIYNPDNYLQKYYPDKKINNLDITGVLFLIFKNLSIELLNIYNFFTIYDENNNKYNKINKEEYNNLFNKNEFKTFCNQLQRLQYYQYKYLKKNLKLIDILTHLRCYTTPKDIYNMIKEHHKLINTKNFTIFTKNIENIQKMNKFVDIYIDQK